MNKMKLLLPSLRERKRYVSFQIISESPIEYSDLEAGIWNTILDFLGEYGVSKTSLWLMKDNWSRDKQTGIISCNHKSVKDILATLGLIDRLGDDRITFKILKISGTIKGAKRNLEFSKALY